MVVPFCKYLSQSPSEKSEELSFEACLSNTSLLDNGHLGFLHHQQSTEQIKPPNIEHELNIALSVLKQPSTVTGDNVFDHLADILKRVVQERPVNIVDYFEELSFNIREQKLRPSDSLPRTSFEPIDVEAAKAVMQLMNLPVQTTSFEYDVCKENQQRATKKFAKLSGDQPIAEVPKKLAFNENVLRLHLYWTLCGFGLINEEVSKLSYALQKIQFHPIVDHARFWGKIYGLTKAYYIVEVMPTKSEMAKRLDKMRNEMTDMLNTYKDSKEQIVNIEVDLNLIPGTVWRNHSEEELEKMKYSTKDIFIPKPSVNFDIPPEAIGTGLNRRTYFVTNDLSDDWIELPVVTPKQIRLSRMIKKFFTGDLDNKLVSYPTFPGTENHFLRAMIARITSATYIAPNGYYRRLNKENSLTNLHENLDEDDEIDVSDGEAEEDEFNNDAIIIENEEYKAYPKKLLSTKSWVHVRPNILEQGRVVYFDEEKALEVIQKYSLQQLTGEENMEAEIEEDMFEEDDKILAESGPALFTACNEDSSNENVHAWSLRCSSDHNNINRLTIARSNLWPGAFSFTFDKYADSIYLGWGYKLNSRNMNISQIPSIQDDCDLDNLQEILDPSVESEEAWKLFQMKKYQNEEENEEEEISC